MGINFLTKKFENEMIELVNNSGLPAINILFVLKNISQAVQEQLEKQLADETESENKND